MQFCLKGGGKLIDKILVVDDEKPLAEILKYNLEEEGYHVLVAYDGETAMQLAFSENPELILLDIMLPRIDGFDLCKRLREELDVPIIMLTAKEAETDKVLGLELGADDYITKPFSSRELVARIKATLRRVKMGEKAPDRLYCGELTVDLGSMELKKGEQLIELTHREFNLLVFLLKNAGHVFNREVLLEKVWGYDYFGDARTVDVTIRRLREKIEDDPANPSYIFTKRGAGYYIRRPS